MILHSAQAAIYFQGAIEIDIALTKVPYLYDICCTVAERLFPPVNVRVGEKKGKC